MSGGILNQMPYIRFIAPDLSHFNQTKMIVDALTSFLRVSEAAILLFWDVDAALKYLFNELVSHFKELIQEHRKAHNEVPQDSDRDLIDAYLREIEDRKTYARGESSFSEDQLVILLLDLFLAGAETTNSTLGYAFLYLLHFPEWQHNLQKEIDSVVEPTEEVQMKHKIK